MTLGGEEEVDQAIHLFKRIVLAEVLCVSSYFTYQIVDLGGKRLQAVIDDVAHRPVAPPPVRHSLSLGVSPQTSPISPRRPARAIRPARPHLAARRPASRALAIPARARSGGDAHAAGRAA